MSTSATTPEYRIKSPQDVRTYELDLTPCYELKYGGELLAGDVTAAVTPPGLTVVAAGRDSTNKKILATLSGGTAGTDYTVRLTCATDTPPHVLSRAIIIKVQDI